MKHLPFNDFNNNISSRFLEFVVLNNLPETFPNLFSFQIDDKILYQIFFEF